MRRIGPWLLTSFDPKTEIGYVNEYDRPLIGELTVGNALDEIWAATM